MASVRRRVNRIHAISTGGGVWDQKADIEREIIDFYKLYNSDARFRPKMDGFPFRQLSHSRASFLEEQFNKEELRQIVIALRGDRLPAPDGFLIIFFQQFWDLIEDNF